MASACSPAARRTPMAVSYTHLWDLAMEYLLDRSCWLDTSSSFAFLGKVRSKEIIRAYGADRLLFGDDFRCV